MATPTETWQNTYSALDIREGYTGVVMKMVRAHLPKPVISPTCAKTEHKWSEMPSVFPQEYFPKAWSRLYACERCAKRGLIVFRTDGFERDAA